MDHRVNRSNRATNSARFNWGSILSNFSKGPTFRNLLLILFAFIGLSRCTIGEEDVKEVLSIALDTASLGQISKYDSIVVNILRNDGTIYKSRAFVHRKTINSPATLEFEVPEGLPGKYTVQLVGYVGGAITIKTEFKIPKVAGQTWVIAYIGPGKGGNALVTTVAVTQRSLSLEKGALATQLIVTVSPDSAPQRVLWRSDAPGVATVDSTGKVHGITVGETIIHALAVADTQKRDQIPVSVREPSVGKPKPNKVNILTGNSITLARKDAPLRMQVEVLPYGSDQNIIWSSSNPKVASVDAFGNVSPDSVGITAIIAQSAIDLSLRDTLEVTVIVPNPLESVTISPKSMTVYIGGETPVLSAAVKPVGQTAALKFTSSDTGMAEVGPDGRVKGKAVGTPFIFVSPLGNSHLIDTCRVTVVKDVPVLDVGSSRRANLNEELTFQIKVFQKHGKVVWLKWDLNGDGKNEDSIADSTASPKWRYTEANKEVIASFYVIDSEGNPVTATVKVAVGRGAPLVDITKPSKDTLVNSPSFTLEYTVDGVAKTKQINLTIEGLNEIPISETNADGTGTDIARINLDTRPPRVEILAPTEGALTNNNSITLIWEVDDVVQNTRNSESLSKLQGSVKITREAYDAAGNRGEASVNIVRDTIGPGTPNFTSATTASPTNITKPTWVWESGGDGGSGVYRYVFNGQPEVQTQVKQFSPTDQPDGSYTFSVRELDATGNPSQPASRTIVITHAGPTAPVLTQGGTAREPSWTWTRSSPNSTFRIRLYKAGNAAAQDSLESTTASYAPDISVLVGSNGVDWTLKVSEKNVLNWGDDGESTVRVDVVAPSTPSPTAPPYSQGAPTFSWTSVEAGARYPYRLIRADNGTAVASGILSALTYTPTSTLIDGVRYRLFVSAQDGAGNFSPEGQALSLADLNAPSLAITSPALPGLTGTNNPAFTGTAFDAVGLRSLTYMVDGGSSGAISLAANWTLSGVPFALGTRRLIVTATDSANRTASAEVTVTKLEAVVFVRKGGSSSGGSSWESAYSDLNLALNDTKFRADNPQIWVADGSYSGSGTENNIELRSNLKIYGGFNANGSSRSLADRKIQTPGERTTVILNSSISGSFSNLVLDGFSMQGLNAYLNGTSIEIRNSSITGFNGTSYVSFGPSSTVKFLNTEIAGNSCGPNGMVWIWNATVEFNQADIHDNSCIYHDGPVVLNDANAKATLVNSRLYRNTGSDGLSHQIGFSNSGGGTIAIDAASLTQLQGGVCAIGRRGNGNITNLSGVTLNCP